MANPPQPPSEPEDPTVTAAPEEAEEPTAEGQAATFDFMPEK